MKSKKRNRSTQKINLTDSPSGKGSSKSRSVLHQLQIPSDHARSRCYAVPLLFEDVANQRLVFGRLGFDSWEGSGIGLRDISDGHVRRLKFEAGQITIELVAERHSDGWEYIARVYKENSVTHEFVLEAGQRRILPYSDGFYLWTSNNLLRKIRLIALDRQINFGGIQW